MDLPLTTEVYYMLSVNFAVNVAKKDQIQLFLQ